MKFLKSKCFVVCVILIAVIALVTGVFAVFGRTDPVRIVLNTVAKPFVWCGARVADAANGFVATFRDYDRLREENEALRQELESVEADAHEAELLREENAWLKDYLALVNENPQLVLTDARIIAREADSYSTVLTLDRGSVHGVRRNMPVLTEEGVFGHVKELGLDWCRVVSIVETESSVGAYSDRTGVLGVVSGDVALREGGRCRMTHIENTADIRPGDRIYTAGGSGSIYPPGLLIGTVVAIEADEYTRTLSAEIEPAVDFAALNEVARMMIVCGYETGGGS